VDSFTTSSLQVMDSSELCLCWHFYTRTFVNIHVVLHV
jgi:phage tail protein X